MFSVALLWMGRLMERFLVAAFSDNGRIDLNSSNLPLRQNRLVAGRLTGNYNHNNKILTTDCEYLVLFHSCWLKDFKYHGDFLRTKVYSILISFCELQSKIILDAWLQHNFVA